MREPRPNHARAAELRALAGPVFTALERTGMSVLAADARQPGFPIVFVNAAFTALTGYDEQETIGRDCRFLQGPGTDPATAREIGAALRAGQDISAEILNYRRDGSPFWNSMVIVPVTQDGQVAYFLSTQSDVTTSRAPPPFASRDVANAAIAVPNWQWHIARNRITGNARFAALCGLTPLQAAEGIEPGLFFAAIHEQDRARIRLALGAMLRGAEVFAKEFRMVLPDGGIRWVDGSGRCHLDAQDRPAMLNGILVDITEQKRVEERLRIAQTAGGIGTFEYVQGFGTVSVSPQFCRLLGLHPARDLPVRTINALVQSGENPIIDTASGLRVAPGTASEAEFRILRADDSQPRWITRRGEYLRDTGSAGLRLSGVIYDITVAKRTEQQLRTLTESLESQVEARTRERDMVWRTSQDLFLICGFDYVCHSANPAWSRALGYAPDDLTGQRFDALVHPDDVKLLAAHKAKLTDTADFDVRIRARDGSYRHISWHVVPEGERFTASGRDITERRVLEDQLRQSQKMEAVGQLTGGLAHDFNNLLTGIAGSLELLQSRIAQGRTQDLERYITAAQGASRRAASLTHRLLAFSRQQTLDARPTDVNRLVAGLEELIRRTVGPGIDLVVDAEPDLWTTLVDQNQLENALLNLCINARDAMPDGGRLTIRTGNLALDTLTGRAHDLPAGDYITLTAADTGTGMTPDVAARAFDPFFTTKPLGQGTGLGLSMIYGFVRQSGGQVRIASRPAPAPDAGAVISLYLPRYLQGYEAAEKAPPSPVPASRAMHGETVLVVDDEETVRMLLTEVLHTLGYTAIVASDAPSGLQHLQSGARIDMLVTDVGLPGGMNGRQIADMGRALRPDLKVLFITGYAEKSVLGSGHLGAAMRVLTKPFTIEALTAEIQGLFEG